MSSRVQKLISFLFSLLFFATPLIFFPYTSEIFEFNKMVFVYLITTIIVSFWILRMIQERKIIFRRTILDIPLLLFLFSQIFSTLNSIDVHTSIFGYYGRFHGGLLSTISYLLLYWTFVSNLQIRDTKAVVRSLIASALIVSVWGILEHFGKSPSCLLIRGEFNADCWIQDVQHRVFATLGQPNWMAAFIVAVIPLAWAKALNSKLKSQKSKLQLENKNFLVWIVVSLLLYLALLYTKSRSGLLAFGVAYLVFWLPTLYIYRKKVLKIFTLTTSYLLLTTIIVGTPWSLPINRLISSNQVETSEAQSEPGGTESAEIRKIVWKGAIDIWKYYPLFGTGIETFAFSYSQFRPPEHNLVSEWDFIYNKAHNEYLNYLANSGILGLGTYSLLIFISIYQILKLKCQNSNVKTVTQSLKSNIKFLNLSCGFEICDLRFAIFAGYAGILITNFFGFSVVLVGLLLFLFPAFSEILLTPKAPKPEFKKLPLGKVFVFPLLLTTCYLLLNITRYWFGDYFYALSQTYASEEKYTDSLTSIGKAINLNPIEPLYYDELANIYSKVAIKLFDSGDLNHSLEISALAIDASDKAINISPRNLNLKRSRSNILTDLTSVDSNYLFASISTLEEISALCPTDAKALFSLGLSYVGAGEKQRAINTFEKAVHLKPNYEKARYALALLYLDSGMRDKAISQLDYILKYISPDNEKLKKELDDIIR